MDRKPFRGPQILIIAALLLAAGAALPALGGKPEQPVSAYDREIRKKADALDSVRAEIGKRRSALHELEKTEGNYLARLEFLESTLSASKKYLLLLSRRIDTAETTIARLNDSLRLAGQLLSGRQVLMKQRLRRAYLTGFDQPLRIFFLAKNPLDAVNRVRYLEAVYRYDRLLIGAIGRARENFNGKKTKIEAERAKLGAFLAEKKKEHEMQVREDVSRRALLEEIRFRKKSNMAVIAELEAVQMELNGVIKLLGQKRKKAEETARAVRPAAGAFGQRKGALPWPLDGRVAARFGKIVHPLYKTVIMNNGIDISGRGGAPVRSVADGTVIYTGSMRGLGRLVIVDHGSGYLTIYGRLSDIRVSVSEQVGAGSTIGSGGDAGETAELHFEIRRSTDALDPLEWLEQR